MYLQQHPRKKKDDIYNYYSIAESYREDGKSKKRIIAYLGALTPEKVQQIRNVLKISISPHTIVTTLDDLIFEDHWHYLDIAFLNHLWDNEWGLSELFLLPEETDKTRTKAVSYTHLRAHETRHDLVCRLLLEKKKKQTNKQ